MSITVPQTMDEFIRVLGGLECGIDEVACLPYLPSALFPRDSLAEFFRRGAGAPAPMTAADRLWERGRRSFKALAAGHAKILVEAQALSRLCNDGVIHPSMTSFEVGYATRIHAMLQLARVAKAGSAWVVPGPVAFAFLLSPPDRVLLDVTSNSFEQRVQGVFMRDSEAYGAFDQEAKRLMCDPAALSGATLIMRVEQVVEHLKSGRQGAWS